MSDTHKSLNDLTMADSYEMGELLDRASLQEMLRSFEDLFGVPARLYSASGQLLADTRHVPGLYALLEQCLTGRVAVQSVIDRVRRASPKAGAAEVIPCVSGGQFLCSSVTYEGRVLGRTILGPYVNPELAQLPEELRRTSRELDPLELEARWRELPRLSQPDVQRIDGHLRATLSLLVFSGLKAHLASNMHMASVKESFRELNEKNEKLQLAHDRLKELDRLKSNFLATVSHELRTPLTSIIGYSEMLIQGIAGELSLDQREFVDTIYEKGEQLLGLIKTLLDLSKLESGTMSLRKEMISSGAIVRDVVATLTPVAKKKGVKLLADAPEQLTAFWADAGRLRQVLLNLTENALKFTLPEGSVTVGAREGFMPESDTGSVGAALMFAAKRPAMILSVVDTGVGILPEDRVRVFDAFYQVDNSSTREAGGTGLGLSIVKRLVEAHDGLIEIASNGSQGTIFSVVLPMKKPSQ